MTTFENLGDTFTQSSEEQAVNELLVPLSLSVSNLDAIKIKKNILDWIALKTEKTDIIFELSTGCKLDSETKEILFSLSLIKEIRKVSFVGDTSVLGFSYNLFKMNKNIRNYKTKEKAASWFFK